MRSHNLISSAQPWPEGISTAAPCHERCRRRVDVCPRRCAPQVRQSAGLLLKNDIKRDQWARLAPLSHACIKVRRLRFAAAGRHIKRPASCDGSPEQRRMAAVVQASAQPAAQRHSGSGRMQQRAAMPASCVHDSQQRRTRAWLPVGYRCSHQVSLSRVCTASASGPSGRRRSHGFRRSSAEQPSRWLSTHGLVAAEF